MRRSVIFENAKNETLLSIERPCCILMPQGWNIDMICLGLNYLNIPLNIFFLNVTHMLRVKNTPLVRLKLIGHV